MKKDTHPQWYPDAKIVYNDEVIMIVGSTEPEMHIEIWSGTHPFYTGKQQLVDTARRVEKFQEKLTQKETKSKSSIGKTAKKAALREHRMTKMVDKPKKQTLTGKGRTTKKKTTDQDKKKDDK